MKVLHLGKYYPPYPGGIETYCKIICEALLDKGISVDIVVSNNTNQLIEEKIKGVNVFRLPRKFVLSSIPICPRMPSFVKMLVRKNNYDVIHLHYPNPMGEISYLFGGNAKKLIITHHTDASMRNKLKILYTPLINKLFKTSKHIIVLVDKFVKSKEVLNKHKDKCRVIPIPVNPYFLSEVNPTKTSLIKERYGNFVLFIGNLSKYKGEEYLIAAMRDINCNLVIIGTGSNITNAKKQVADLQLEKKVFFLGSIENCDLKEYYDACEIFCLPSISPMETFGIVLLEAMARGKPVISTELGTGTSFVNVDGHTGFVVGPKSSEELSRAINKLLSNNKLRNQMGDNGRRRVIEEFTTDKVINSIMDLYAN